MIYQRDAFGMLQIHSYICMVSALRTHNKKRAVYNGFMETVYI